MIRFLEVSYNTIYDLDDKVIIKLRDDGCIFVGDCVIAYAGHDGSGEEGWSNIREQLLGKVVMVLIRLLRV